MNMSFWISIFPLILLLIMLNLRMSLSTPLAQVNSEDLDTFHSFSAESHKTLTIHGQYLYIGAKEKLFRQDAENISHSISPPVSWTAPQSNKDQCKSLPQGRKGEACYNFVETITPYNATHMLLCGSYALRAQNAFLNIENGTIELAMSMSTPFCSYDPSDNGTAVAGMKSTTIAAMSRQEPPEKPNLVKNLPDFDFLFATQGAAKMIESDAQFVSSFRYKDEDSGHSMDKLYFIFGEILNPSSYQQKEFRSIIAQVCADDQGGARSSNHWTTFVKARLICQSNEDDPFVFDIVRHSVVGDDGYLYAIFTTRSTKHRVSAVCVYEIKNIQQVFHSRTFFGISKDGDYGSSISKFKNPSPGDCAFSGMNGVVNATTKDFTPDFIAFVQNYPLVESSVLPVHPLAPDAGQSGSLFSKTAESFTQIAVQAVVDVQGKRHQVIYVAYSSGKILKLYSILKSGRIENRELAYYAVSSEPITGLLLSDEHNFLYVETDSQVMQLATANCEVYSHPCKFCDPCRMCVLSRDPMCGWNNNSKACVDVRSTSNVSALRQDVLNGDVIICGDPDPRHEYRENAPIGKYEVFGDVVESGSPVTVSWFNKTEHAKYLLPADTDSSSVYLINSEKQLVIKEFSTYDISTYVAEYKIEGSIVAIKSISYTERYYNPFMPTTTTEPGESSTTKIVTTSPVLTVNSTLSYRNKTGSTTKIVATSPVLTVNPTLSYRNKTVPTSTGDHTDSSSDTTAPPPMSPSSASPLVIASAVLASVLVIILVSIFFYRRYNHRNHFNIRKKNCDPLGGAVDIRNEHDEPDAVNSFSMQNQSNNSSKSTELLTSYKHIVNEKETNIDKNSETDLQDNRQKARSKPMRSKSFQSKTIRVNVDNKDFKCHSIRRDKERRIWVMEVKFPKGYTFDDLSGDDDDDGDVSNPNLSLLPRDDSGNSITYSPSCDVEVAPEQTEPFTERDLHGSTAGTPMKVGPYGDKTQVLGNKHTTNSTMRYSSATGELHFPTSSFDDDTDSDSTLRASSCKHSLDSSMSSTASTPKSENIRDNLGSIVPTPRPHKLTFPAKPINAEAFQKEASPRPNSDASDKSSSASSSLSNYRTPPRSPLKKIMQ